MKLKLYDTLKILFLSVLITYSVKCSQTETSDKINISEGFMKHKKTLKTSSSLSKSNSFNTNLVQKKERIQMKKAHTEMALKSSSKAASHTRESPAFTPPSGDPNVQSFNQKSHLLKTSTLLEAADKLNGDDPAGDSNVGDLNIGSGPVFASGWVKYFKYTQTSETKRLTIKESPRTFTPNGQYFEQYKFFPEFEKNVNATSSDGTNDLPTYIPDGKSFYAILLQNSLNILTSRQVIYLSYLNI